MPDRDSSDTLENLAPEGDETLSDMPRLPAYDHAPATIEERLSPFHESAEIRVPTIQGMPVLESKGFVAPAFAAPSVPQAAPSAPDGPTDPQGVPALAALQPHANPEGPASWDEATEAITSPSAARPAPEVPSPDAPNILVSKSMEFQVAKRDAQGAPVPEPTAAPKVRAASPRARVAAQPTEVMLPALKRKKTREKEGSDLPLVLGLIALILVIGGIIALVVLGVMGRLGG